MEELADSVIQLAESNIVAPSNKSRQNAGAIRAATPSCRSAAPAPTCRKGAEELGVTKVVVPPHAGVLSAAASSCPTMLLPGPHPETAALGQRDGRCEILAALEAEVDEYLNPRRRREVSFDRALEMRYVGQAFEVTVPLSEDAARHADTDVLSGLFGEEHHRIFEFSKPPDDPVEIVSFRVGAKVAPPAVPNLGQGFVSSHSDGIEIEMLDRGARLTCHVLPRAAVPGTATAGPLLIEDGTSTIYVPPGWRAHTDERANIVMQKE